MTNDITIINASEQGANEKGLEVCLREEATREQAKNARELFSSLQCELDEMEGDLSDGLSYLDMKNDTLLSYMIDLCNIVLRKVRGDTISGNASVERSVYYRVILEKIKAIDQRLAYQLNKVITMPDEVNEEEQGINVKNLDIDIESSDDGEDHVTKASSSANRQDDNEEDDDEEEDEDSEFEGSVDEDDGANSNEDEFLDDDDEDVEIKKVDFKRASTGQSSNKKDKPVGVYKPPKLRSVAYSEEKDGKAKRRRDYNEFYQDDDGGQDIVDESQVFRDNERTKYEEENYTRLPSANPKREKRKAKAVASKGKKKFKSNKKKGKW